MKNNEIQNQISKFINRILYLDKNIKGIDVEINDNNIFMNFIFQDNCDVNKFMLLNEELKWISDQLILSKILFEYDIIEL